ncbi:hypothetical protein WCLP8_2480001 [uncultured Gammaproteobacteria bacterium]
MSPTPPAGAVPGTGRRRPSRLELDFLSDAEAIEQRPLPVVARITLYLVLAMVVSVVVWASLSELDSIVVASGRLITTPQSIVVQPLETSMIRSVEVEVGQIVHRGQTLAKLDPTFSAADLAQLLAKQKSLHAEVARCQAELSNAAKYEAPTGDTDWELQAMLFRERQASFHARINHHEETLQRLKAQIETIALEQNMIKNRLKGLKEIVVMRYDLFNSRSGAGSRLSMLEAQDQHLELMRELQQIMSQAVIINHEILVQESERDSFVTDWRQKLAEEFVNARRELDGVTEQFTKAQRRNELVVMTAPADAVVLEIAQRGTCQRF